MASDPLDQKARKWLDGRGGSFRVGHDMADRESLTALLGEVAAEARQEPCGELRCCHAVEEQAARAESAEAACALMREALLAYNMATNAIESGRPGALRVGELDALRAARRKSDAALSTDAGARALKVLDAARRWTNGTDTSTDAIMAAVRALDGEGR